MDSPLNRPADPDADVPEENKPYPGEETPPEGQPPESAVTVWEVPEERAAEEPAAPVVTGVPVEEEARPKQPGRARRFFSALLRWTLVVLLAAGLGFALAYTLLLVPMQAELERTQNELRFANEQLTDQQADLDDTRQENEGLVATNQALQEQMSQTEAHVLLLQALSDVRLARLYLAQEDGAAARAALEGTPATLQALEPAAAQHDEFLATATQDRLNLVMDEIPRDARTADTDLGTLETQLLDLEKLMFPE